MARIRKIEKNPPKSHKNYYLIDASFIAEKYLPIATAPNEESKARIRECKKWWKEIDRQVDLKKARVYIPDICIAEAYKVLAKKYFKESAFDSNKKYNEAKQELSKDITTTYKELRKQNRHIKYHDMPTTRDVIIAVDRFYESFIKHNNNVGVVDLIIVANAKYLMDFHDAERRQIHIITFDKALWSGIKKISELPNAYFPGMNNDTFDKVFK